MARRAPQDVYADLVAAGFTPAEAVTMTAIAGGESGYDPAALGDVGLQTPTWGPSFGLYQIRTLKADTGKGTVRDIQWLRKSTANQARAAYVISQGGADFNPWTVYRSGAFRRFLDGARSAAAAGVDVIATATEDGPFPVIGPDWAPWNWPSNAGNAAAARIVGSSRNILVEGLAVALGPAVLGFGVARAVAPPIRRAVSAARDRVASVVS